MVTFDDVPELKRQLTEFDESIASRLAEIQSARNEKKSTQSNNSVNQ